MKVLPPSRARRVEWFEQRLAAWAADPGAIGLSAALVAELAQRTADARAAHTAQRRAINAARAATVAFRDAEARMAVLGRGLVRTVKAFAETADDLGVYAAAKVPPPSAPSPAGAPDAPTNLRGSITNTGAVLLRWDGTLERRTFYEVHRRVEGERAWTFVASLGARAFLDETVAPGSVAALYRVRARRGTLAGPDAPPILVCFGVAPGLRRGPADGARALAA